MNSEMIAPTWPTCCAGGDMYGMRMVTTVTTTVDGTDLLVGTVGTDHGNDLGIELVFQVLNAGQQARKLFW